MRIGRDSAAIDIQRNVIEVTTRVATNASSIGAMRTGFLGICVGTSSTPNAILIRNKVAGSDIIIGDVIGDGGVPWSVIEMMGETGVNKNVSIGHHDSHTTQLNGAP